MDYESMSVAELKELAKEKGLKGIAALKKAEICELLKQTEQAEKKEVKKKTAENIKAEVKAPVKKTVVKEKKTDKSEVREEKKETESVKRHEPVKKQDEQPIEKQAVVNNAAPVKLSPERQQVIRERAENAPRQMREMRERPEGTQRQGREMRERPEGAPRQMREMPEGAPRQMREMPEGAPRQMREMSEGAPRQMREMPEGAPRQMREMPESGAQTAQAGFSQGTTQNAAQTQQNSSQTAPLNVGQIPQQNDAKPQENAEQDSGIEKNGILEIMPDGFGFIRCDNFLPGSNDVYVSNQQIRRYGLRSGDIICGNTKAQSGEKFSPLLYVKNVNGYSLEETAKRKKFENLTPIFPKDRIHLETPTSSVAMRMVDLIAPIGKGQRGMIVSQPKSGKTTLLKEIANSITRNHPDMHLIILLIDERPEEVTDMKESIKGDKVEVIYSTFDELPDNHKRVSEMVIERAKRLVEHGEDVVILLDSITRLARAYNLTVTSSGRTLSGGLDPAALHMPKKFFGAARTMREGGSLTILATALVETGSRMDDVVFEEFKGTGNMELVLDRNLSERRIFPAIDLAKSGTRRDDLLLTSEEYEAMSKVRRILNGAHPEEATEKLINMCAHTRNNREFVMTISKSLIG